MNPIYQNIMEAKYIFTAYISTCSSRKLKRLPKMIQKKHIQRIDVNLIFPLLEENWYQLILMIKTRHLLHERDGPK